MTWISSCFVFGGLALASLCCAQAPAPPAVEPQDPEPAKRAVQPLLDSLREQGIAVDLDAKTVAIDAVVNQFSDPLEYLLIHRRGKGHEALFVTEVKPSLLNSAFLLLGYDKGTNATYKPIEPPPTDEEIRNGADWVEVFPPKGKPMYITATWKAAEGGEPQTVPVESLVLDGTTGEALTGNEWIFLGGRLAPMYRNEPEVFIADYEGNLISICYLAPDNHLVTMKHERARDDQNWWITDACPAPGTAVQLRFHFDEPEVVANRRKAAQDKPPQRAGETGR